MPSVFVFTYSQFRAWNTSRNELARVSIDAFRKSESTFKKHRFAFGSDYKRAIMACIYTWLNVCRRNFFSLLSLSLLLSVLISPHFFVFFSRFFLFNTTACLVSFATETVMQLCHGRRRCTISADTQTFGNPCRPDSRMYLKTVYTCGKLFSCFFILRFEQWKIMSITWL